MRRHTFGGTGINPSGVATISNLGAFISCRAGASHRRRISSWKPGSAWVPLEATEDFRFGRGPSDTFTGMGYGVWPEIRAEYEIGPWGLGLSVGYLASLVDSVADSNGQILQNTQAANATLHTEGVSAALFGVYHFTPPLN